MFIFIFITKIIKQKINIMAFEYDLKTDIRFLEGREEGREEGIEEGVEKTVRTSVLNLNKNKVNIITIAEAFNITQQKVIEIINKQAKK